MINKKLKTLNLLNTAVVILFIILLCKCIHMLTLSSSYPIVNCVMVTLNDSFRRSYVEKSILNFHSQTYKHKRLIIVDQSADGILPGEGWKSSNVTVFHIPVPHSHTLGSLRNMVLNTIPHSQIWTTWDDDDWRDHRYIDIAINQLRRTHSDFMMLTQRIDYNTTTDFAYGVTLKSGLYASTFAYVNDRIRYDNLNSMEDQCIKRLGFLYSKKPTTMVNDPLLYIRLVHGNNTSQYVKKQKTCILDTANNKHFFEWNVTSTQLIRIREILSTYYNI